MTRLTGVSIHEHSSVTPLQPEKSRDSLRYNFTYMHGLAKAKWHLYAICTTLSTQSRQASFSNKVHTIRNITHLNDYIPGEHIA